MKPGHIRVFDGLRITTEHVDHLQGSLHSALEDLRTILGLGRVHYGFEVEAEGAGSIVVRPGLAFDWRKNRIVLDEPKSLPVAFASGEQSKYVSVRYDQIEDGQVEGQFTLVWDACAAVVTPDAPAPGGDLIPIARLDRANGNGAFDVVRLIEADTEETPVDEEDADATNGDASAGGAAAEEAPEAPATNEGAGAAPVGEAETSVGSEAATSDEVVAEEGGDTTAASSPLVFIAPQPPPTAAPPPDAPREDASREPTAAPRRILAPRSIALSRPRATEARPAVEEPPREAETRTLGVRQGVARLTADNDAGDYLGALLTEPFTKKLSEAKEGEAAVELSFNLTAQEVELGFPPAGLTCHTLIKLGLTLDGEAEEKPAAAPYAKAHAVADGEATLLGEDAQQFGLTTVYAGQYPDCELTEHGVARLPLRLVSFYPAREEASPLAAVLDSLELHVRVARAGERGFRVLCGLSWSGAINEEVLKTIEGRKPRLTWETLVAWKALGDPFALTR